MAGGRPAPDLRAQTHAGKRFGAKTTLGGNGRAPSVAKSPPHDARTALLPKPRTQQLACPGEVLPRVLAQLLDLALQKRSNCGGACMRGVEEWNRHSLRGRNNFLRHPSGKSVRWVADQLGHSTPMLTLRTYAHAMREEEADLGFANFVASPTSTTGRSREAGDGAKRLYPAPTTDAEDAHEKAPALMPRGRSGILEHETGIEPATSTLATWCSTN